MRFFKVSKASDMRGLDHNDPYYDEYLDQVSYQDETILRNEWGFEGSVISDMFVWRANKSMYDLSFRAGCDLFLTMKILAGIVDKSSPTAHAVFRRVLHNVTYTVVNSNAMQGVAPGSVVTYDMSPWAIWLIVGNIVAYTFVAAGIVWIVIHAINEKKNPGKYQDKIAN